MLHEFLTRIGTFCILIGIGILVLFVASAGGPAANFDYLFWAILSIILGYFLRRQRPPPSPSGRFSTLRRLRGRDADDEEHR